LLDPPMKFTEISARNFDLAKTLDSGQVFHWDKIDNGAGGSRATWTGKPARVDEPGGESINGFCGTIGETALYVEQRGDLLKVRVGESLRQLSDESRALPRLIENYFALDHPLAEICASFPDDPVMNAARVYCHGLRIIRQPKWECLATFICSSMKQIAHIRQISQALRRRFGAPKRIVDLVAYTFPSARRLGERSEKELRECALGYRAKNLLATSRLVASENVDLNAWSELTDDELRARLCELPGVGAKVANCVMLFAYERLGAFPIDVWIERVLKEKYFPHRRKTNSRKLQEFSSKYFGPHGGYAQQYLFHHARKTSPRKQRHSSRKSGQPLSAGPN
jgi:N-glycosylase/DNA lyase